MSRLLLLLAATTFGATPGLAQHSGHSAPAAPAPQPTCSPEHAAMGHCTLPEKQQPAKPAAPTVDPSCPPEHAAMGRTPSAPPPTQHGAADPHAGHDMASAPADVLVGPPPPEALTGPEDAADAIWGGPAMEHARAIPLAHEHGGMSMAKLLIDQAEVRFQGGHNAYFLNAEGWYGGDFDKLWLKTEIEGEFGHHPEQVEFQALWAHAIGPWVNSQTGLRLDAHPDKRARLVVGAEGLAPYWIEFDVAAFLSDKGDVTARAEVEHDVRITQKLILQPRAELDFAAQDIPEERVAAGLSTAELGLRLRYQVVPNFAPYVGANYERAFGDTRDFVRADGDDPDSLSLVVGLRAWF